MESQKVTLSLKRYEELVKKEFILDKLMEDNKGVNLYLSQKGGER